jgi:putative toxin-antitoxin system antitoxin component (TIGR02293 family)
MKLGTFSEREHMATPSKSRTTDKAARIQQDRAKTMDLNESVSKVRAQAAEELGSAEAAEKWLMTPAMGLEQRRPIDLMHTMDGIALVTQLLSRMHFGVYS